jgi:hypothetical protein
MKSPPSTQNTSTSISDSITLRNSLLQAWSLCRSLGLSSSHDDDFFFPTYQTLTGKFDKGLDAATLLVDEDGADFDPDGYLVSTGALGWKTPHRQIITRGRSFEFNFSLHVCATHSTATVFS